MEEKRRAVHGNTPVLATYFSPHRFGAGWTYRTKHPHRGWRDSSVPYSTYCSCKDLNLVHEGWLTTVYNSRTLRSPWILALTCTYPYTHKNQSGEQNTKPHPDRQTDTLYSPDEQWTYDPPSCSSLPRSGVLGVCYQAWLSDSPLLNCNSFSLQSNCCSPHNLLKIEHVVHETGPDEDGIRGAISLATMISFSAVNLQTPLFSLFAGILWSHKNWLFALCLQFCMAERQK